MQLQHLTGSLGFLSMQALQNQVQGLMPDVQLPPTASSRQASTGRQPTGPHSLASLHQAAARPNPAGENGSRNAAASTPGLLPQPRNASTVPPALHAASLHPHAAPQAAGGVNSTPFPRQSALAAQPSLQGAGMQTLPMMRSSPPEASISAPARRNNSRQQVQQPQGQHALSMAGRCVGGPLSAEAVALWNSLERTVEAQQFRQRTRETAQQQQQQQQQRGAGAPLGQAVASNSRSNSMPQQEDDVLTASDPAGSSVSGGTDVLPAAAGSHSPGIVQHRIDCQRPAMPDYQVTAACVEAGDPPGRCGGEPNRVPESDMALVAATVTAGVDLSLIHI